MAGLAGPIIRVAGPNAFKNTVGFNYEAFTYCPNQKTPYENFTAEAKAFAGDQFERASPNGVAIFYEGMMLYKAAVEGSKGKTDGPTIAAWIEANVASYNGMFKGLAASPSNHFLLGPTTLVPVHPEKQRPGGMFQRTTC